MRGNKLSVYIIIVFLLCIVAYGIWYFIFNIYEVKYEIQLLETNSAGEKLFKIINKPINLLGKQVPFRKVDFDFEILFGDSLINLKTRKSKDELFFSAKGEKGNAAFKLKDIRSLFPQRLELNLSDYQ